MKKGVVYANGVMAGELFKDDDSYVFIYHPYYVSDPFLPPISLTLPKTTTPYQAKRLFPFFFGLLSEGKIKDVQCRHLKIDENDDFTRLLKTTHSDTIGAVTIVEAQEG